MKAASDAGAAAAGEERLRRFFARYLLVHTHIEKTGGSTLTYSLEQLLGPERVADLRKPGVERPSLFRRDAYAGIWLLAGHFHYGDFGQFLGRRKLPIAIVRDPLERYFSYYRFVVASPAHPQHGSLAGRAFEEVIRTALAEGHPTAINNMARKIAGRRTPSWRTLRGRVEKDYLLVVPQQALDPAIAMFWRCFRGGETPRPIRRNVGVPAPMELSEAARRAFEAANALDRRLYERVLEAWPDRLARAEERLERLLKR